MQRSRGIKKWLLVLATVTMLGTSFIIYNTCVYNQQGILLTTLTYEEVITNNSNLCPSQSFFNSSSQSCSKLNCSKTIFIITPTYKRLTQKIDLTSMCQTLMHVPNVVWIIIEDAPKPTQLVTNLLQRCTVKTVHLIIATSATYKARIFQSRTSKARGIEQRNAALIWLRNHYSAEKCNGVVYFGDDDNKYDLRLFHEMCKTENASVWKVAWRGELMWEGPTCKNGRAISWDSEVYKSRVFPVDMAGFAIHLCQFFKHPEARLGVDIHGFMSRHGYLETDLLEHFTTRSKVECRGSETEAYVWHSQTSSPLTGRKKQKFIET